MSKVIAPSGYVLTSEQQRKQEERRQAKLAKKAAAPTNSAQQPSTATILRRKWLHVAEAPSELAGSKTSIATWNLLAQTLVRRELFPGSDCLKWKDRENGLVQEFVTYPADVMCLQEVDKLDSILPHLPEHEAVSAKGYKKLHGLVVLYRPAAFRVKATKTIYLDEEYLLGPPNDARENSIDERRRRRGGTRQTKNICLMVALERVDDPTKGVIVATTHLFWHPDYVYERCRQALIVVRALQSFRNSVSSTWPAFLAGDFNTQPSEPCYHLLRLPGVPLPADVRGKLNLSRVIHTSTEQIDPTAIATHLVNAAARGSEISSGEDTPECSGAVTPAESKDDDGDDDEGGEEDKAAEPGTMKNTRRATEADGLLNVEQLEYLAREILGECGLFSCYGSTAWKAKMEGAETFGDRGGDSHIGTSEPAWTIFSPLYRLTLDYILLLPSSSPSAGPQFTVTRLLAPPKAAELEPGLPRKGITSSDHVLLMVEGVLT